MINRYNLLVVLFLTLAGFAPLYADQTSASDARFKEAQEEFGKLNVSRIEKMFQSGKIDLNSFYWQTENILKKRFIDKRYIVLDYAAFMGDLNRVKLAVEQGTDINAKTDDKETVLHYAAQSGNLELVEWLVKQGCDINAKTDDNETVLHFAAQSGNLELVQWLVKQGLDVSAKDDNYMTALHFAAKSGNLELVQWLVKQGFDIKTNDHFPVLQFAALSGSLELVQWLVDQGLEITDGLWFSAALSGNLELAQWLVKQGIEIDDYSLRFAVRSGNLELVQWLVNRGADIHSFHDGVISILGEAASSGNVDMTGYLIAEGVNPNESLRFFKVTALEIAAFNDDLETVQYLVEHGASVNPYAYFHLRPFWCKLSFNGGDPEIVHYLRQRDNTLKNMAIAFGLVSLTALCAFVFGIYWLMRSRRLAEND